MSFQTRAHRALGSPKEITARAVGELGGVKRAAHTLKRSPSAVSAWTLASAPTEIPYGAVQAATLSGAVAFADDICALAGGTFVPASMPDENIELLVARASESFGRFLGGVLSGPPGALPETQAARLRTDLNETIRALTASRMCLLKTAALKRK